MISSSRQQRVLFDKAPILLWELDLRAMHAWIVRHGLDANPERIAGLADDELAELFAELVILDVNDAGVRSTGATREELIQRRALATNRRLLLPIVEQLARGVRELEVETELLIGDGSRRRFVARAELPTNPAELDSVVLSMLDVTDARLAAERLHDARRLDSLALLAGSVAHDFNNVLTVVQMSADRLGRRVVDGEASRRDLERLRDATTRASRLARQLLLFSRREIPIRQVFDPDRVLADLIPVVRREIDPAIAIELTGSGDGSTVDMDPSQLEQVVRNLVLNAADAMPAGGVLEIACAREATSYRIVVSDTGGGMPSEVQSRAFEPFFTTRPGKRAGLGLSIVHGIVHRAGGTVRLETSSTGTRIEVALPASDARPRVVATGTSGTERVLLVEDEVDVRDISRTTLEEAGYHVVAVPDAADALVAFDRGDGFDVVISDLVMNGLDGRALVEKLRAIRPTLPVLYVSGYAGEGMPSLDRDHTAFLAKPFTGDQLLRSLRSVLERVA